MEKWLLLLLLVLAFVGSLILFHFIESSLSNRKSTAGGTGRKASATDCASFNPGFNITGIEGEVKANSVCSANPNAEIVSGKCVCKVGFYGDTCEFSFHTDNYYAVGDLSLNAISPAITSTPVASCQSFCVNSCESKCDIDPNCKGFYFESGTCNLINDNSLIDWTQSYNTDCNNWRRDATAPNVALKPNTYMKIEVDPLIRKGVYLFVNALPTRWWVQLAKNDEYRFITKNVSLKLDFNPNFIYINDSSKIYLTNFDTRGNATILADIDTNFNGNFNYVTQNYIVASSSTKVNIPSTWPVVYAYSVP